MEKWLKDKRASLRKLLASPQSYALVQRGAAAAEVSRDPIGHSLRHSSRDNLGRTTNKPARPRQLSNLLPSSAEGSRGNRE
jgi:hypothetical protein